MAKRSRITEELMELITCTICKEIMIDEIYQCKSGHLYCDNCIDKIRNCSICETIIDKSIRARPTEHLRDQLELPCKNPGCSVITNRHKKHKEDCEFNRCGNKGCDFKDTKEQLVWHQKICKYRIDECAFLDCKAELQELEMRNHLETEHKVKFNKIELDEPIKLKLPKKTNSRTEFNFILSDNDIVIIYVCKGISKINVEILPITSAYYVFNSTIRYQEDIKGRYLVLPISPEFEWDTTLNQYQIDFNYKANSDDNWYPADLVEVTLTISEH